MRSPSPIEPLLLLSCGNPSRGDDALGSELLDRLQAQLPPELQAQIALLTDFQLQIEQTLDMVGRRVVILADAALSGEAPFAWQRLTAESSTPIGFTTHHFTPRQLTNLFYQLYPAAEIEIWQLAIRGYAFELGAPLSPAAALNLDQSVAFLVEWLAARLGQL